MSYTFSSLVSQVQQRFDDAVDHGCDQQLFYSGYLNGHFSLVVGQMELAGETDPQQLQQRMQASLQKAFDGGELEPQDQQQVMTYWQKLFNQAS